MQSNSSDLRSKTISGIRWSLIGRIVFQVINFGINLVLARLLTPEDFGLVAMIMVVIGYANIIQDFGIAKAIIQSKDITNEFLSTAFWLNVCIGLAMTLLVLALAKPISIFYKISILQNLTIVLAFNFLVRSVNIVQMSLLHKAMDFKKNFAFTSVVAVLSGTITIILAIQGYGVWCLVIKSLSASLFLTLILWIFTKWTPKLIFNPKDFKKILSYSLPLLGSKTLLYVTNNLDSFLIGKKFGSSSLGNYNKAFSLMINPVQNITQTLGGVLFSSFSIIQDDIERVKRGYENAVRMSVFIIFPISLILIYTADVAIPLILGKQWGEVVPIFKVLAPLTIVKAISSLNGTIYASRGRTGMQFRVNLITRFVLISSIIVGLQFGLLGLTICYLIGSTISSLINTHFAGKLINLPLINNLFNLRQIFVCSLNMFLSLFLLSTFTTDVQNPFFFIALNFIVGTLTYIISAYIFKLKELKHIKILIIEKIK